MSQPGFAASLRALPREAWFLFAGTFINRFGSFVIPFLTIYVRRSGFTDAQAALALTAYGLGHLLAAIIGGDLADRIGRRKTISLSMFSSAASMLLLAQAESLPAIVLLTALAGLTTELYRPASGALLADLVGPENRVTAFAALRWALNAGFAFGPATAGFLSHYSFKWLFIGDAITSVLYGLIAWFFLPHGLRPGPATLRWGAALRTMIHDHRMHKLMAAQFAIALVFLQMSSTFGLHVTSAGLSAETYGLLLSLNGVLIVCFELPLTAWTRRLPPRPAIAAGYVLIGLGFAAIGWATTVPVLIQVVVIFTLGEMIAMPLMSAYIVEGVPAEMRGRYLGTYGLVWALGLTLGPAGGVRLHASSPMWLWFGCGALGLAGAAVVLWARHARQGPIEPGPLGGP